MKISFFGMHHDRTHIEVLENLSYIEAVHKLDKEKKDRLIDKIKEISNRGPACIVKKERVISYRKIYLDFRQGHAERRKMFRWLRIFIQRK